MYSFVLLLVQSFWRQNTEGFKIQQTVLWLNDANSITWAVRKSILKSNMILHKGGWSDFEWWSFMMVCLS